VVSLASVFVEVRPDTSHFSTELKSTLAKTREAVEVAATLDTKKLKPELDALKAELKSVTVTKAKITADAAQASARIRELKVQLEGLNEEVRINGGPTPELTAKIRAVKAEMASIKDQRAKISVDSAAASAHIKALSAQLAVFGSKEYTAKADVDTKGINFAFRGVSMLTTAIVSLAPIAVPVLATVTAGVGVLGSAFMSAGGAAGLYGIVAAGALAQAKKDLNKKAAASTDPAKAAALRKQAKDMLASLPVAERQLLNVLDDFEGKFRTFLRGVGPAVYGPMVKGINLVTSLFKPVTPLINAVGGAVEGLLDDLVRLSKGQGFRNMLAFFELTGPAAITHFGHIAGNIIKGIYFLFRGFAPFQGQFLSSFENMTARFARWSEGFGSSNQFRGFMRYAQKVLPDVRDLFIQLTQFVGRFIVALGPLGGMEIKILLAVLRGLNSLPPRVLQGIAIGITAVVVGLKAWELGSKAVAVAQGVGRAATWAFVGSMNAETGVRNRSAIAAVRQRVAIIATSVASKTAAAASKVWAGAQWLLNAALAANPLGLFIIGIAAVAAGLVIAYKKSTTFRNIVNAALNAVKDAAHNVIGWFTRSFVPFFTKTIPNAFQSTVSWVKRNWPVILAVLTGPIGLATLFISRHWDTITKAFKDGKNWVTGTFKRAWNDVQGVIMNPLNNARDAIGRLFGRGGPIRSAFSDAVNGIKNIWSNLSGAVRAPIRYIVNTVFNKGIVPFVNRIPFIPGTLHTIGGFDVGGYTGRGGKYEPAGIVHRNEHVIRSESTESVNKAAPGFLDHLNKHGAKALQGILPGFRFGGPVTASGRIFRPTAFGGYGGLQPEGGFNAVDIGVPQGTPVHAAASGRVTISKDLRGYEPRNTRQNGFYSYGRYIQIHHAHGNTIYAHLVRRLAGLGLAVRAGEIIGYSGHTGHTLGRTGDHVHFGANGSPGVYDYLRASTNYAGTGTAPGTTGGGGGGGGAGYGGPSAARARAALNPANWISRLTNMGPWGHALGGMIGGVVGRLRSTVVDRIKAAVRAAGDFLLTGGTGQFTANSSGVWKALRGAGWNQAAAAGIMGNMQYESGFSPTIIQGGGHGTPEQAGSRGYGLVQWTPASKIARMLNGRAPTVGNEVAALTGELRSGYGSLVSRMQGSKSPVNAAMAFLHEFERPANPNQPQRGVAATAWFNRFARENGAFDFGGVARGVGLMPKMTPLPERVLSPRQTDLHDRQTVALEKLAAGGGGRAVFKIYDVDRKLIGTFEGIADDRIAVASDFGDMETRAGL
jgi:murein DD-endopeptidase MepM/ murein hydrolase activator NlpD